MWRAVETVVNIRAGVVGKVARCIFKYVIPVSSLTQRTLRFVSGPETGLWEASGLCWVDHGLTGQPPQSSF
jgi:hypothetical protein